MLMATLAALINMALVRRRTHAARSEALRLQREIDAAMRAQVSQHRSFPSASHTYQAIQLLQHACRWQCWEVSSAEIPYGS